MYFSNQRRDTRRPLVGLSLVILFHVAIVYALLTGLAKKVVDVVRAPIETKVIEEVKKPPPPPEVVVPPPPRLEAPPPPFIPPPEVQIATPPPPQPTITAVPTPPPPAPVTIAPVAPPEAPPAPPAPPPPRPQGVASICTKTVVPVLPAINADGKATISVVYTIQGGKVTKVDLARYSFPGVTDRRIQRSLVSAIEAAAAQYVCPGDHSNVAQDFVFDIR